MTIGILKEPRPDQRVAILPDDLKKIKAEKYLVETSAGAGAFADDAAFTGIEATIMNRETILQEADVLITISGLPEEEIKQLKKGQVVLGMYNPLGAPQTAQLLAEQGVTCFSMELVPRTSRAQSMDVLSSMATIAGYKAILMAADNLPSFFPMFMTAAGSIKPAKVLILGAGVAGLQAIATARRLGAVVEAFDVRSAVKEEVESLGAKFVEVEGAREDIMAGGYAVEQTEEYKQKQQQAINKHAIKADVMITTAQIPGREAPLLISSDILDQMKKGSVIVDLAASSGGNVDHSKPGERVEYNGITIFGPSNLPADMPRDGSLMYGKNIANFFKLINKEGSLEINFEDDIVKGTCLTHQGEIVNERVKELLDDK